MLPSLSKKRHDDRKNPASAEFFTKQRKLRNQERPKQIFDPVTKIWSRTTAV